MSAMRMRGTSLMRSKHYLLPRAACARWTSPAGHEYASPSAFSGKPMNPPPAEIGASVEDIETPALIIDLDALDRNIAKMADFARAAGVRVRPHAKTHKSTAIA